MIINKLKPFVTSFSEVVAKYDHGTEVVVGGEIKHIFVASDCLSYQPDDTEIDLNDIGDPGVYMILDDRVGTNNIVLPTGEYERFKEKNGFYPEVGMIVLAIGRVMKLDLHRVEKGKVKNLNKHSEQTTRIAAYHVGLVPEHKEETSESGN